LFGAGITTATVLGARLVFPKTTRKIDEWLSRHIFAPAIQKTNKLLGIQTSTRTEQETLPAFSVATKEISEEKWAGRLNAGAQASWQKR
jgi:hypothetical protein